MLIKLIVAATLLSSVAFGDGHDPRRGSTGAGNTGDVIEQVFEDGRATAVAIIERVVPCMAERSSERMYKEELVALDATVAEIEGVEFVWNSKWPPNYEQNVCVKTEAKKNAAFYLSWEECRKAARDEVAAAQIVISAALSHRVGMSQAEAAKRSAMLLKQAASGVCGDFLPQ